MSIIISNHAKKRIKQRLGFKKSLLESISLEAYSKGITHKQTKGSLRKYIDKLYLTHETANNCRIYKEKVFIFHNNILITIIDLPSQYKKYINKE